MSATYLLRLDDACHTMNRQKWQRIEDLLDRQRIRPIVAVVPDNRDPDLCRAPSDAAFWDRVRRWQAKGWTIAMHGYQHLMHDTDSAMVLPFYRRSEFAGLSREEQAAKIAASWRLFAQNGVAPTVWVAPAHCFEWRTLEVLAAETPIRIVSDGIARDQFFEAGFHWIPQQLWQLAEKRAGLWTVCLHPDTMTDEHIDRLQRDLETAFAGRVGSLDDLVLVRRRKSLPDELYGSWFWQRHRAYKWLGKARSVLRG